VLGVRGAVAGGVGEDEPAAGQEDATGMEEAALDVVEGGSGVGAQHMICLVVSRQVSHFLLVALVRRSRV